MRLNDDIESVRTNGRASVIKVHGVMTEGFLLKERPLRSEGAAREGNPPADTVTISEEGRKKRVFGHVMASISGPDVKKTP